MKGEQIPAIEAKLARANKTLGIYETQLGEQAERIAQLRSERDEYEASTIPGIETKLARANKTLGIFEAQLGEQSEAIAKLRQDRDQVEAQLAAARTRMSQLEAELLAAKAPAKPQPAPTPPPVAVTPAPVAVTPAPREEPVRSGRHVVQEGETLSTIANKYYGTSISGARFGARTDAK